MKTTLRLLIAAVCLSTQTYPTLAQWIRTNAPPDAGYGINCVAVSPASGGTNLFTVTYSSGVWLSTDYGTSWVQVNAGLPNRIETLAVGSNGTGGTNIFAAGYSGVFRSTNNGTSWAAVGPLDPNVHLRVFDIYPGGAGVANLFAGDPAGAGILVATDSSTKWKHFDLGLTTSYVGGIAVFPNGAGGTNLFAVTIDSSAAFYRSTNNGTNWTKATTGMTNSNVSALNQFPNGSGGTNLFAGTHGSGVFLSTDNGTTWTAASTGISSNSIYIDAFAYSPIPAGGANLFAGTYHAGVFRSTDNGTSWTAVNTGLTNIGVDYLVVVGTYLVAVTNDGGVWRRPLTELIVSIEKVPTTLPTHFSLDQNYPNPFNPSTTISFSLPSRSLVSVKVFDALGREVAMLLKEDLTAGTYTRQWNAGALPSGVYFYRLQTGSFIETKKLILQK